MRTLRALLRTPRHHLVAAALIATLPLCARGADKPTAAALIDQSVAEGRIDPNLSKREADAALELLQREPNVDLEIRARLQLCDYYSERDQDAANAQIAAATALLARAQRPALRARILDCQGQTLEIAGQNEQALVMYGQAVAIATDAHDDAILAEALLARGYVLGLRGDYAAGLNDLRRSQALFEQNGLPLDALTALLGVAVVYTRMGDYSGAQALYERALEAQRDSGLKREETVTLINLGRTREHLLQWDSARDAFAAALDQGTQLGYPRVQAYALRGLAAVANAQGEPHSALSMLDRAETLQAKSPDARLTAQIALMRGVALHQLMRLKESVGQLQQALSVFRQADSPGELVQTYDELAAVSSDLGNWRDAYDYRTLAQTQESQLLRNQIDQRFATLKVEFDTVTQQKANAALMRENRANQLALAQQRRARNLQTAVIVLTALLVAMLATVAVRLRRNTLRMRALAMTDELTDLPNRRAVLARLAQLVRHRGEATSILIIDIDHFKSVNDRHGHLVGDETLKLVTANLREVLVEPAFFGRLGGEEFAALLPSTCTEAARTLAESLRERVMNLDLSRWLGERRITVSIGIATATLARDSISSMLRRADAALYAAKEAGRNCVRTDQPPPEEKLAPRVA